MFGFDLPKVPEIEAEEVWKRTQKKEKVGIVDVRTPHEYSRGNIEGSINIPVNEIAEKIEKVIPNKDKTIYVYCLSGSRSVVAVDTMQKLGYKKVFSMISGLLSWRAKGFSLTQSTG